MTSGLTSSREKHLTAEAQRPTRLMHGSNVTSIGSLLLFMAAAIHFHAGNSQLLSSELNSLSLVYGCVHEQASETGHAEDAL